MLYLPCIDTVADIRQGLPNEFGAFDAVIAWSVLEHLTTDEFHFVLQEIKRVCKVGALVKIPVPYFSSEAAFSTIDHKIFLCLHTFWRYRQSETDPATVKRLSNNMIVRRVWHTHRLLRLSNAVIMRLVNANPLIAIFYQHFICWLFPMSALDAVARVVKININEYEK